MIRQETVDGRPAMVAYLTNGFVPVEPDKAEMVKVIFTDDKGGSMFAVATKEATTKFNPNHDDKGRFASAGGSSSFVSPNVRNLGFDAAVSNLAGERHALMAKAVADINRQLGLTPTETTDVVGAWMDGAEDSFMVTTRDADWATLRTSAAMQGYIADQKSVLVFQAESGGDSVKAEFRADGDLTTIHQNLLADGIANHTLVPEAGGARVVVVDIGGQNGAAIIRGAQRYGAQIKAVNGRAEFIGTQLENVSDRAQRDDAREQYSRVISGGGNPVGATVWAGIRDRWLPALETLKRVIEKIRAATQQSGTA